MRSRGNIKMNELSTGARHDDDEEEEEDVRGEGERGDGKNRRTG